MEHWLLIVPLASAFLGAVAAVVGKELVVDVRPRPLAAASFVYIFCWTAPLGLFLFEFAFTRRTVLLLGAIVAIDAAANYCFFRGLDLVDVSDVSALVSLGPLFTAVFAAVLLPGAVTVEVVVAAVAVTAAVYAIAAEDGLHGPLRSLHRGTAFPLMAGALFGLSAIPAKMVLSGATGAATLYWIRSGLVGLVLLAVFRPSRRDVTGHGRGIALRGLLVGASWLLYYAAVQEMNVVLAVTLAYTTPVFTLLLAWEELGERITVRRVAAIMLIVASIAYVQI